MTPEEKAKELIEKFRNQFINGDPDVWAGPSKACAIIAVDEIINIADDKHSINYNQTKMYWQEVRKQLELL